MLTSHVGSFPLTYNEKNFERALLDLASIGIDVPPFPQLRSFVEMYLEPLVRVGIIESSEQPFLNVEPLSAFDMIARVNVADSIPEIKHAIEIVKGRGLTFSGLRAPITGIFTLSSQIYVDKSRGRELNNSLLATKNFEFLEEMILRVVDYVKSLGYTHLFFDEPVLGVVVGRRRIALGLSAESIVNTLSRLARKAHPLKVGVHVCGRITPLLLEILCQVDGVTYLNFEFAATPQNIDVLDKQLLEKYDKIIAPGIVNTKSFRIESVDEACAILRKVIERVGEERIDLVSGDCGFGALREAGRGEEEAYSIAISKLQVVVEAVRRIGEKT